MSELPMHVMAGLLLDADGCVLLAQRPPGKHLAGLWEFPGGKREADEAPWPALVRELREELGIAVESGQPLIRVPWRYGERELLLDAWCIRHWHGTPASLEGQALQWREPAAIDPQLLTPADRPILQALRLPGEYWITPVDLKLSEIEHCYLRLCRAIESEGVRLLQLRMPTWPTVTVRELAARLLPQAREHGAQLLLNGDHEGARRLGSGVGVQLKATQLASLARRPLPFDQLVGASCHDVDELSQAARIDADFATLSPVAMTLTHPDAQPIGWDRFRILAEAAALPVYAMGGLNRAQLAQARAANGQGVAGIRGFWAD